MKYIFFAPEFRPIPGGISEYTYQLAKAFSLGGRLRYLFTNQFQKENYTFPITYSLSDWNQKNHAQTPVIIRKILSFVHNIYIKIFLLSQVLKIRVFYPKDIVLINSLFIQLSWFIIPFFNFFKIDYALLIHGLDIIEIKDRDESMLIQQLEGASQLIINSHATVALMQETLPAIKFPEILVINPPFDKNQYSLQKPITDELLFEGLLPFSLKDKKIISTVCRLVKRKGLDLAIKALIPVLKDRPDYVYLIAGNGDQESDLKELIRANNLEMKVFLLGSVSEIEKYSLLAKSELFIMPNYTLNKKDIEGFGISFVEAQFFKNAIIGGKSGGVIEAVSHDESAFLVDFEKNNNVVPEIQGFIERLLSDPKLRQKMGEKGHDYVMRHFELEVLINRLKATNLESAKVKESNNQN